jgi:predicted metal-dependent hydrolase
VHRRGTASRYQALMGRPTFSGIGRCKVAGEQVEYQLFRSNRRSLGITVEPGGRLIVTAPLGVSVERIESLLRRRRSWIRRQLRDAVNGPPPPVPRQWVGGETHRYLGRQYRLRIRRGSPGVSLVGGFFVVTARENTPARVRAGMERWYREHALAVFRRRAQGLIESTARLRLSEMPALQVRRLAKRWGSCTPNGNLFVNVEAVKLPIGCIDYLLMHELCHLQVPHHGRRFWRLLDACMPDWERWRRRLKRVEV